MKKLLFTAALVVVNMAAAQKFELTPNNFVNTEDKTKDYAILEFSSKSQSELFKAAKMYFTANYKNLKGEGYHEVEPDQIVFTLRSLAAKTKLLGIEQIGGDFVNRYEINFKDGKIMVKPYFDYVELPDGSGGLTKKNAFNKKGSVSIKTHVFEGIQNQTNAFISDLKKGLSSNNDW